MGAEPIEPFPATEGDALPSRFLTVRVHDIGIRPSLTAVCAGYENGRWRAAELARHLLCWVPDFALPYSERGSLNSGTVMEQLGRAVHTIFGTGSTNKSGEPGEILLHAICRQVFHSDTVVSKVFFKTGCNDPVKGFDCVHVVHAPDGLELWLGEAKFHKDRDDAIRHAVESVREHLKADYLHSEFALITDKIDSSWPHAAALRQMIHENESIDNVFKRITIPVLLTYDSPVIQNHTEVCQEFEAAFKDEMRDGWFRFRRRCGATIPVRVRLFLAPLGTKEALVQELDRKIDGWR